MAKSPLLQGSALDALLEYYQTVATSHVPGMSFDDLIKSLVALGAEGSKSGSSNLPRQVLLNIALCITCVAISERGHVSELVSRFVAGNGEGKTRMTWNKGPLSHHTCLTVALRLEKRSCPRRHPAFGSAHNRRNW